MRHALTAFLGLVLFASPGCETDGFGSSNHSVAADVPTTIAAGAYSDTVFSVTKAATASWSLANRSSGSADSFTISILADSEFAFFKNGQKLTAISTKSGTAPASDSGISLPAGDYHFVVKCTNILENCQFSVTFTTNF